MSQESTADTAVPVQDVARVEADELARIFSAENMSLMLELIKPHLEAGKSKLVYLLPQANRIGHFAMESFLARCDFAETHDEILMIINSSSQYQFDPGVRAIVEPYIRLIESPDSGMVRMGFFDGPVQDFGPFTLGLYSTVHLLRLYFESRLAGKAPAYFPLPETLRSRGRAFLDGLSVPADAPIVTVHARDPSYMAAHEYHSFRNASFANYLPAVADLIEAGYWVFRLGDEATPALDVVDPRLEGRLVDLTRAPGYTGELDAALIGLSHFAITCSSGPEAVARMLGVPMLQVNTPIVNLQIYNPDDVFAPKHYVDEATGRRLGYREILERRLWVASTSKYLTDRRVGIEENSPEEIRDAVLEMRARLDGGFALDPAIDARFRAIGQDYQDRVMTKLAPEDVPEMPAHGLFLGLAGEWTNIAQSYCRRNPDFLGS